jgi:hypothetical protein
MSLQARINQMYNKQIAAERINFNGVNKDVFIIKDNNIPPINSTAEFDYLFFIAQFNNKLIPFFYLAVKFNKSDNFIYDVILHLGDSIKINAVNKLINGQIIFCFIQNSKNIFDNSKIIFDRILEFNSYLDEKTINILKLLSDSKNINQGSEDDFVNFGNLFWNFIGQRESSLDKIKDLKAEHGIVVDLFLSLKKPSTLFKQMGTYPKSVKL